MLFIKENSMKKIFILTMFCGSSLLTIAQSITNFCHQVNAENNFINQSDANKRDAEKYTAELESYTTKFVEEEQKLRSKSAPPIYTIPVVFHIIHNFGVENISDEQVNDAIRILNEDFRRLNASSANTIPEFQAIRGDAEIEFKLAQKDPNGNCTNGINRYASTLTYGAGDNVKSGRQWPRNKYLNIYVANSLELQGAAAYAYRPGSVNNSNGAQIDGILSLHSYIGSIGTSQPGRTHTLSHEVGHYLNLPHTWGNTNEPGVASNCNDDDGVSDTPNTIGWTSCNLNGSTCGSLDNVQNFMDYSYCYTMFTAGQCSRMRAALTSNVSGRNNLWTTANLAATGLSSTPEVCLAEFQAENTFVCEDDQVKFQDISYNGVTDRNWTFNNGNPSTSSASNPTTVYANAGKYDVSLTASNATSTKSTTKNEYITVLPKFGILTPISEGFENDIAPNTWFTINNGPSTSNVGWEIANNAAATGSNSLVLKNASNQSRLVDEFLSTTFNTLNLTSPRITFKVAFAQRSLGGTLSNDALRVYVSTDCGNTWNLRYTRAGSNLSTADATSGVFVPNNSQWEEQSVTLQNSHKAENFRFKFQFTSDGGNYIYIDDINITGNNVGIEEETALSNIILYPNPTSENSTLEIEMIESKNIEIDVFDVLGKKVSEVFKGKLNVGLHKFNIEKYNSMNPGIYFVRIKSGNGIKVEKLMIK